MSLSIGQVGFGAAVWAGLLLAFIGHPEAPALSVAPAPVAAASPNAPRTFVLKSVSVELPVSDRRVPRRRRMPTRSTPTAWPVIPPAWC